MSNSFQNYLDIVGSTSKYTVGVQDGSGRIQHYWNSTRGPDSLNKYLVTNENAFKFDIGVQTDPYFKIKHARNGTAGNVISWNEHFTIKKNGWVGINRSNPSYRLDVGGTMRIQNNLVINEIKE